MRDGPVKPSAATQRRYDARRRRQAALTTRGDILDAAKQLFVERGYAATTMAAVAASAGVALDTVYAAVGRKPVLFRLLLETAISGADRPVPADEREYVREIVRESDPSRKLDRYASAVRAILERLGPLFRVLRNAAPGDPELARLWGEISERRAANMRRFAADLAATGALREGLTIEEVADVIWVLSSSEMYVLMVDDRGWTPERFERWLSESWRRLLLRDGTAAVE